MKLASEHVEGLEVVAALCDDEINRLKAEIFASLPSDYTTAEWAHGAVLDDPISVLRCYLEHLREATRRTIP